MSDQIARFGIIIRLTALIILALNLTSCADPGIDLEPGPIVQAVVAEQEVKMAHSALREGFLNTLPACEDIQKTEVRSNLKTLPLGETQELAELLDAAEETIHLNSLQEHFLLEHNIPRDTLIVRAGCIRLPKETRLETYGRSLILISDRVEIEGSLITTPKPQDDEPGQNGGSVEIFALQFASSNSALVQTSGGDAGAMSGQAPRILTGSELSEKLATIRSTLVDRIETQSEPRTLEATTEDARRLFLAWNRAVPTAAGGSLKDLEVKIYSKALMEISQMINRSRRYRTSPMSLHSSSRDSIISNHSEKLIEDWRQFIALNHMERAKKQNRNTEVDDWMRIEGRGTRVLYAMLSEKVVKEVLRRVGRPIYFQDLVRMEPLKGGSAGHIQIFALEQTGELQTEALIGKSSPNVHDPYPEWDIKPEERNLPLEKETSWLVDITLYKESSDKQSQRSIEEVDRNRSVSRRVAFTLLPSDIPPKKALHPNWRASHPLPGELRRSFELEKLQNRLKELRLETLPNRFDEGVVLVRAQAKRLAPTGP